MLPVLLDLVFIKVYTFGAFLVLAFFWGLFWFWRSIKLTSQKENQMFDCLFIGLIGGFIVSRLVFVGLNFSEFGFSVLKLILVNGYPGASLMGFVVGFFLTIGIYLRKKNIEINAILDYFIPAFFLSFTIGKIGSFLGGVDVGVRTTFPLAVQYSGFEGLRHLVALYEAALFIVGFIVSYKMLYAVRRQSLPRGSVFFAFLVFFGGTELVLDKLKENHLYFSSINFNQTIALTLFIIGGVYYLYIFRSNIINGAQNIRSYLTNYGSKIFSGIRRRTSKKALYTEEKNREENKRIKTR